MRFAPPVVAPRPHPEVFESEVGGQRVLFNNADRRLHVLNSSAGAIWDVLRDASTVGEVAIAVSDRFGVDPRSVRRDIERTIDQFRADGLVTVNDHSPRPPRPTPRRGSPVDSGRRTSPAIRVVALDAVVEVASSDGDIRDALARLLEPLRGGGALTTSIEVVEETEGRWSVCRSGEEPAIVGSRLAAVLRAVAEVNNAAVLSAAQDLVFHAGAVSDGGGVVLLPAASNHGKSTLTTALVASGFHYLTDEAAAIGRGRICRPFPKSIALDPGSFPLFPELAPPEASGLLGSLRGREWHVPPSRVGTVGDAGPVRAVICPHWRAGAATRLNRCPPTEALHLLITEAFDFSSGGQAVFERLADLVDAVPVYRLGYGDLDEAVRMVREVIGAVDTASDAVA